MELFLNCAWAVMAALIVCHWRRHDRRNQAERRLSFVALVMLLVILFPVISVSDDLWSIHNPAETDTCQRRDHLGSCPHSIFPAIAALPEPVAVEPALGFQRLVAPSAHQFLALANPALRPIQNRPPPSA